MTDQRAKEYSARVAKAYRQAHPDPDAQQADSATLNIMLDPMERDAMRICFTLGCIDALGGGNLPAAQFIAGIANKFGLIEP